MSDLLGLKLIDIHVFCLRYGGGFPYGYDGFTAFLKTGEGLLTLE